MYISSFVSIVTSHSAFQTQKGYSKAGYVSLRSLEHVYDMIDIDKRTTPTGKVARATKVTTFDGLYDERNEKWQKHIV